MSQNKKFRKFAAASLAATATVVAVAPAVAAAQFDDVTENNVHADNISKLVEAGVITGYPNGEFRPAESIQRRHVAVMLFRQFELEAPADVEAVLADYTDVSSDDIYADEIAAVIEAGFFKGSNGEFMPTENFSREQMATVLVRAFALEDNGTDVDVYLDNVDPSHQANVKILAQHGLTTELDDFRPKEDVQRGQFATFTVRTVEATAAPAVESVSAINAKQIEIKFSQPVAASSLFSNVATGTFNANTVSITSIDSVPANVTTGSLSADGKTLIVNTDAAVSKRYDVVVDSLLTTSDEEVAKYQEVVTFAADTTAPLVASTSKPTSGTVKVSFSEPLSSLGTVNYKLANGTVIAAGGNGVTNNFVPGAQEVTFTLGSDVPANSTVTATFIGTQDQGGNLINPNPTTVSLYKGAADGVAPTVASISQTGATTFAVKFSEELQVAPTVNVGGAPAADVSKDSADSTKYIITAATPLDGATTVILSNFTDLSGVNGSTYSKVISFVKDAAAPKVVSVTTAGNAADGKEYLEITFDKDVAITGTSKVDATGSFVKDYITTTIGAGDLAPTTVSYKNATNKKIVRVELDTLLATNFDVKDATYTVTLSFADVQSAAQISAADSQVTFTRNGDGTAANTTVLGVNNVTQGSDNNKVEVTFDNKVDGASATNVANYKIDGAVVESVTLLSPVETAAGSGTYTQKAVLNLKPGSNGFTGPRNINISGVKALGSSKVMTPYFTNGVSLAENVAPTVTSAKLTATNKVTLTFSEPVTVGTADTGDFELYIGGVKLASNDAVTTAAGTDVTSLEFTLEDDVTSANINSGLVLKAQSTLDIADDATNVISVPSTGINISQ
jgi:hypothetical protein